MGKFFDNLSIDELYMRRKLCLLAIQTVSSVPHDDPRRGEALKKYNGQLAQIDERITEIEGKPPDTVIGLQPAKLTGKPGGIN